MESTTASASGAVTNVCPDGMVSETVIETVAKATGVDPLDLQPLYEVVDPDALDTLFGSSDRSSRSVAIDFSFGGCRVTVRADGEVTAAPTTATDERSTTVASRPE